MKKFGFLAFVGLLFLASFVQAEDTPTEDELQPDTVEDDLGAAREGELKNTTLRLVQKIMYISQEWMRIHSKIASW